MFFVSCLCAIKKNCRKYPIYSCLIFMEHFIKRDKSYNKNNKNCLWSCVSQRSGEASGIQFLPTGNRNIARPFPSSQISTWRKGRAIFRLTGKEQENGLCRKGPRSCDQSKMLFCVSVLFMVNFVRILMF